MKWFIPPTRVTGSKRQTATHEPRSVRMIVGSRVAYTPPTWIATSALPPPDRSPLTDALRAGRSVARPAHPAEPPCPGQEVLTRADGGGTRRPEVAGQTCQCAPAEGPGG